MFIPESAKLFWKQFHIGKYALKVANRQTLLDKGLLGLVMLSRSQTKLVSTGRLTGGWHSVRQYFGACKVMQGSITAETLTTSAC